MLKIKYLQKQNDHSTFLYQDTAKPGELIFQPFHRALSCGLIIVLLNDPYITIAENAAHGNTPAISLLYILKQIS